MGGGSQVQSWPPGNSLSQHLLQDMPTMLWKALAGPPQILQERQRSHQPACCWVLQATQLAPGCDSWSCLLEANSSALAPFSHTHNTEGMWSCIWLHPELKH